MNKRVLISFLSLFLIVLFVNAQVVTTSPASFVESDLVSLTFDATQGDAGLKDYTGDVYAHIGVVTNLSSSNSDWKYVKAAWSSNTASCKCVRQAANSYLLTLTPDVRAYFGVPQGESIYKIALVFRSSDGTKTGKAVGGSDILIALSGVEIPHDGVTYLSDTSVKLTLTAPNKSTVHAIGSFNNWTADASSLMTKSGDKFTITLTGLTKGVEYQYQYKIDNSIVVADPYTELVIDPDMDRWIPSTAYPGVDNAPTAEELARGRTAWFKTGQTPYNWQVESFTGAQNEDLVVYELLIRDWQRASLNGSDRGIIKTLSDSIDYFKRLNINAIHIMPFNEFEGDDSWGYNPSFYFAPDKAYGPKNEYKRFIDLCHQNGIAVIMDLVLNHSFAQSPMALMYWDAANSRPAANNPWYNPTAPHTCYGWGMDFNHQSSYTQKFIDDVTAYWLTEYKIDGFRFDFTKGFTQSNVNCGWDYDAARVAVLKRMADQIWAVKPGAYVILEHLADNSEEKVLSDYNMMLWSGVELNTKYSEAVMGWNDGGSGVCKSDISSVSYKNRGWNKSNLMAYMESHDEERLAYKAKMFGNFDKSVANVSKRCGAAAAMYFTVPGPKLLWQFGERAYDVSIDSIGRTDAKPPKWEYMTNPDRLALWKVYSNLINLKINEEVFRTTDFGIDACNVNGLKRIWLQSANNDVRVIANFGVTTQSIQPFFSKTGVWYDHFSGTTIDVSNVNMTISLAAGEFKLYSTKQMVGFGGGIPTSEIVNEVVSDSNAQIYPQPCSNEFTIISHKEVASIEIYTIQGELLSSQILNSNRALVQLSNYPPSLYFVKIFYADGSESVKKFLKQ